MATRLYVGNLPFSATEEEVRTIFGEFGTVDTAELVIERGSGRPRGFGFVQMDDEGAVKAMQTLNGKDMGGRSLTVNEAKERTATPRHDRNW